ncbi:antitoxin [Photorhabdus heterorhabditis]|uniref:antitoxin n=1 Tax=Photorhabdus heterorhabditis TaxID=880156 RepID=UPI0020B673C7|nr:AbrB/MazE/SpoVT family DNA-binding domain-containing protein [Photorhabdus heterorhabditis]
MGRVKRYACQAAYWFDSDEVFIRKNPEIGDVILSCKPHDWAGFFAALKGTTIPNDFLSKDERCQQEQSCDLFEGWKE